MSNKPSPLPSHYSQTKCCSRPPWLHACCHCQEYSPSLGLLANSYTSILQDPTSSVPYLTPPRPPTKAGLTTPTFGFPVSSTDLPMKPTTLYFSLTVSPVLFYPTLDSLKEKTPKPTGGSRYSINAACRGTRAFTNECPSPPPRFQKITNKERAGEFPSVPAAAPGRSSGSEGRRLSLGHGELGSAGPRF